jgi:hypothetical protein
MFRVAESLVVLRDQIDGVAPHRSRASDGTIGDPAHRSRASRHNPNDHGVVCALDVTDDPAHGCPIHVIADRIRANPHPELAYVISNGRIASRKTGFAWHQYTGANPHVKHAHFAVGDGADSEPRPPYDGRQTWTVGGNGGHPGGPGGVTPRPLRKGAKGEDVRGLQKILIGAGHLAAGTADGVFGPQTEAATKRLQAQLGLIADGIVGARTHAAIARLLAFLAAKSNG